jgi:hypothetical protein
MVIDQPVTVSRAAGAVCPHALKGRLLGQFQILAAVRALVDIPAAGVNDRREDQPTAFLAGKPDTAELEASRTEEAMAGPAAAYPLPE